MMIAPLLFALTAPAADLGPMLPPGTHPNFHAAAILVEQRLAKGDFAGAEKATKLLPKTALTIKWDDAEVPASLRAEYARQRDEAIKIWSQITQSKIKISANQPDIKFAFVKVLPNPPGSGIPAGATYFWSENPSEPRLETVIGLKRMTPPEDMNPVNVFNEVASSIGSYFGLATQPFPGSLMGRSDVNNQTAGRPSSVEMLLSRDTLRISQELRDAVHKKLVLTPTEPKIYVDTEKIELGTVVQGDDPPFNVQFTNNGNAPLAMRFQPDCGCVLTSENYQVLQPGANFVLKGSYSTFQTVGDIRHTLLVHTNDAEHPSLMIPVSVKVTPRYRFLMPEGNVIKLPEGGISFPIYLVLSENSGLKPNAAQIAGIPGSVEFEPWTGTLPDPGMGESAKPRSGYKLNVHLTGALPVPGRAPVTLWMTTDHKKFPSLQVNFFAQRGIVVLPQELYMGEVAAAGARKYSLIVSGPAKSFKIKKVTSDWPHVSFEVFPNGEGTEYRIQATYDGKAPAGLVSGRVDIETDDKNQPVVSVPIRATIK